MCGHYPVFSVGSHGDTDELQDILLPLMEKYGVDVYFSGHDHLSAHLRLLMLLYSCSVGLFLFLSCRHNGIHYFVAGAGSMTDAVAARSGAEETLWVGAGYSAFVAASVTGESFSVTYVKQDGSVAYKSVIWKDRSRNGTNSSSAPSCAATDTPTFAPTEEPRASPTNHGSVWYVLISGTQGLVVAISSLLLIAVASGFLLWRYRRTRDFGLHDLLPDDSFSTSIGSLHGISQTSGHSPVFAGMIDAERGR